GLWPFDLWRRGLGKRSLFSQPSQGLRGSPRCGRELWLSKSLRANFQESAGSRKNHRPKHESTPPEEPSSRNRGCCSRSVISTAWQNTAFRAGLDYSCHLCSPGACGSITVAASRCKSLARNQSYHQLRESS